MVSDNFSGPRENSIQLNINEKCISYFDYLSWLNFLNKGICGKHKYYIIITVDQECILINI